MAKLGTVEMGRGLAATAVVLFHANFAAESSGLASSRWMVPLQYGVDFFFVLSGFIIFHVHGDDIGRGTGAGRYLAKRAIRLFPALWIIAGGYMLARALNGEVPSWQTVASSLLLYPSVERPVPLVVWTLRHELLFYAAFMMAILHRRAGLTLFAVWTLGVLMQMVLIALGRPMEGVPAMVLSSFHLNFAFGALLALAASRLRTQSWWPLVLGLALVVALGWTSMTFGFTRDGALDYTSPANLFVPLFGLAFTLVLLGLLCLENRLRVPRWAMLLGAASYAIYLVHSPMNAVTGLVAGRMGNGAGHLMFALVGIATGILFHLLAERPVTAALRRAFLPAKPAQTPSDNVRPPERAMHEPVANRR